MSDFFSTDAGEHLLIAAQYSRAARVLADALNAQGRVLFRPALSLAGHGLEMLLKSCMYWNDRQPPNRGPKGHAIELFWQDDVCEPIRAHIFKNAIDIAAEEEARGRTVAEGLPSGDLRELIEEYVLALGKLHGEQPLALRYVAPEDTVAPRPGWLVQVLERTTDDFVKRPDDFKLAQFLGLNVR